MKKLYEVFIISIIFFAACLAYKGQQRISVNGGKGWDGVFYYNLTEQIKAGANPIIGDLPFIKRLGTPFLAATFSKYTGLDIFNSFLYINLIGAFIAVILLYFWLKHFIQEFWITGLLCFLFIIGWYLPVRFSFYYPMSADSWGAVWFLGALLLYIGMKKSYKNHLNRAFIWYSIAFSIVIAIGNLFRESNSVLCLLPFFILNPFKIFNISANTMKISHGINSIRKIFSLYLVWQTLYLLLPVLFILIANAVMGKFTKVTSVLGYSYFQNILSWLYLKTLPEYLLGVFIAYGPLILLVPFYYKKFKALFWEWQELFVLLILSFVFGLIGGSDTERILFMSGFPVVFLLLGISIREIYFSPQKWWLFVLLLLQSISYRLFWSLPDFTSVKLHTPFPFFGLLTNHFQYHSLFSHFSNSTLSTILLIEYIFLFLATWYVLHNKIVLKRRVHI